MFDKNSVEITGTITHEPVHATTENRHTWSNFNVCVRRPKPSKAVDYVDITAWNENAMQVCEEFHAGDRISVRGRVQKQSYVGNDGQKHFKTRIIADEITRPVPDGDEGPNFDESETVG